MNIGKRLSFADWFAMYKARLKGVLASESGAKYCYDKGMSPKEAVAFWKKNGGV